MSENKPLLYGVNKGYYAVKNVDAEGKVTYSAPVRMPGLRQITINPEGGTDKFYADNGVYFMTSNNNGLSGSIEVAGLSDQFLKDVFKYVEDDNGVIFEDAGAKTANVALLFECENDGDKPTLFEILDVKLARPSQEHNTTEDSTTPDTVSMDYEAAPIELPWENGTKKVVGGHVDYSTKTATKYDAWYQAVTLPTKAAA